MTLTLVRKLWCWGGLLALFLCLAVLPLSRNAQFAMAIATLFIVAAGWVRDGKKHAQQAEATSFFENMDLPSSTYRHPIVLLGGDGADALFGGQHLRITQQGCYVRLPSLGQMNEHIEALLALRPEWAKQLSIAVNINPQQQSDAAVLAGQIRTLHEQLIYIKKRLGHRPRLLLTSYLSILTVAETATQGNSWFVCESTLPPVVRHTAATSETLTEWLSVENQAVQAQRFTQAVVVNHWLAWMKQAVLPYLTTLATNESLVTDEKRSSSLGSPILALTLLPALPQQVNENLWQQWCKSKTTLPFTTKQQQQQDTVCLPYPDPLLFSLPQQPVFTPRYRTQVQALWLFTVAGVIALSSSAWQNGQLLRQVSDDLRRYHAIPTHEYKAKSDVIEVLRTHAEKLDNYYRKGAPIRLGWGLYPGEKLRQPVLTAIANYRPPEPEKMALTEHSPIRLDSLALFDAGQHQLKTGSTKVLVEALFNIKAKPGWLIMVAGHTDATGDGQTNQLLSLKRAQAVRDWMLSTSDVSPTCFAVQGFGATKPIAPNETVEGRAANRRVEISLMPQADACQAANLLPSPPKNSGVFTQTKEK